MSLFENKGIQPMLLGENNAPFDDPKYIFELKLDGIRGIAYLDPAAGTTDLRNKRDMRMLSAFPELCALHERVSERCILDGEIIVTKSGVPDFFEVQKRSLMSNGIKIQLAAKTQPANFVAFDILQLGEDDVHLRPLMERKALLQETVVEGGRLAVSRYVEQRGVVLYELAKQQGLEGVVAKRRDSVYLFGRTAKDWLKIKNLVDDDYVICGYIDKSPGVTSLVLGQYDDGGALCYKGHVTLGVNRAELQRIKAQPPAPAPFASAPRGNEQACWIAPCVGTVQYMPGDKPGLRQPVFKGLRQDKRPEDCVQQKIIPVD